MNTTAEGHRQEFGPILELETAAGEVARLFAESVQSLHPHIGASWLPVAGGVAGYAGDGSPLSAVKGAGPGLTPASIIAAETFFFDCGSTKTIFELGPWIPSKVLDFLESRGYQKVSEELVMLREIDPQDGRATPLRDIIEIREADRWSLALRTAFDLPDTEDMRSLGLAMASIPAAVNLGVESGDGFLGAAAQLLPLGEVAILGGDGTLPSFRGKGWQSVLIRERVRRAALLGCRWCVAEVLPEGGSMRNYLRCGFRKVYSRIHWQFE